MDSLTEDHRSVRPITTETDTREILAHAARQVKARKLHQFPIVDIDAHHVETLSWQEILQYVENDVLRDFGLSFQSRTEAPAGLLSAQPGLRFQDMAGRIPHQQRLGEKVEQTDVPRDVVLSRRAMDTLGVDYMVIFPTPMLSLGTHPLPHIEAQLSLAYNRWLTERILNAEPRLKSMIYLPFSDAAMSERIVEEFADHPGVVGFMVTSTRGQPVYHDRYMRLYAMISEREMPLGFHAGLEWSSIGRNNFNRFISAHAITFVLCNMIHLTNWIINGMPERFPNLKLIWIESGIAWIPFMMQRLDNEYLMRSSEAPLLKRLPSEYMQDMFFSTQPMERTHPALLEATFKAIKAETQVLYSSDWPHWDFDLPSVIYDLAFLDEGAKQNILGGNAMRLFRI